MTHGVNDGYQHVGFKVVLLILHAALLLWLECVQAKVRSTLAEPSGFVTVGDEERFTSALEGGAEDIVITSHLDLTSFSISVAPATTSIVGNCTEAPSQSVLSSISGVDLLALEPGQCLLLLSGSISITAQPSSLWLHNLYLRYTTDSIAPSSSDAAATELLTLAGGSTWCEQVTLQGDGTSAVQGVLVSTGTASSGTEADAASASFSRVKFIDVGFGPPALGIQCAGVTVENSTFSHVTAAEDSAIIVGDTSTANCFTGCQICSNVQFTDNDAATRYRADTSRVIFFTEVQQQQIVYLVEVDFFNPTSATKDAPSFPLTFINNSSPWVVQKRKELGYSSVSSGVATDSTQESGASRSDSEEQLSQAPVDGVSSQSRSKKGNIVLTSVLGSALVLLVAVLALLLLIWRRRKRRLRLAQQAGDPTKSSAESEVSHSAQHAALPAMHSKEYTTEEEYIYPNEIYPAVPWAATTAMHEELSPLPTTTVADSASRGTVTSASDTPTASPMDPMHPSPSAVAAAIYEDSRTATPLQRVSQQLAAPSLAAHAALSDEHSQAAHASGSNTANAESALVSMNDMWAQVSGAAPKAVPGKISRPASQNPPEAARPVFSGGSPLRPPRSGGNIPRPVATYHVPSGDGSPLSQTVRPDSNNAVPRAQPHSGATATATPSSDASPSRTTTSHATTTSQTADHSISQRDTGTRLQGELGTLSITGSGGTLSEVATTDSQRRRPSSRGTNRSRNSQLPRRGSNHGLDCMGFPSAGLRSLDRGGSVQSRGGREMLPELQEPQADDDDGDSAAVKDAVEALVAQHKRQRSSGGHEIIIGSLQLVLVNEPVVKGRRVVQQATVVKSEASAPPSRKGSGLGSLQSELSLSRQKSAFVRERDNVELQVFVDHADFTADQTLRRSPLTPLLRTQLAAYEHPGGGACTTYTSSPPTSGAGAEREASEQCPQLFDYCVSAVAPVHCDLAGVLSGAQQLGGGFTELVVLEKLSRKFNTLHGEVNRAHLNFHPAQMVCSQREWYLEGFQCSASLGVELPVEWLKRRRTVCSTPLIYSAPELIAAEHNEVPLVATGALDCWAVGVTVFQLFFRKEAEQSLPISDEKVLEMALGREEYPWESLQAQACKSCGPQEFQRLALSLLQRDPLQRCTADSAMLQVIKLI